MLNNIKYRNIIELYNKYYSNYMKLLNYNTTNIIFINYYKIINKNTCFTYINNKLNKFNMSILSIDKMLESLNKPSHTHGTSVNNSEEALSNYFTNQELVKKYIFGKTNIHQSVDYNIEEYFTK